MSELLVLRQRGCPCCHAPDAVLAVLKDEDSGRLFLMCDEVEEGWWSPASLGPHPDLMPNRDLRNWRAASWADLDAAGWDRSAFAAIPG